MNTLFECKNAIKRATTMKENLYKFALQMKADFVISFRSMKEKEEEVKKTCQFLNFFLQRRVSPKLV
jgi:hypothetical protein